MRNWGKKPSNWLLNQWNIDKKPPNLIKKLKKKPTVYNKGYFDEITLYAEKKSNVWGKRVRKGLNQWYQVVCYDLKAIKNREIFFKAWLFAYLLALVLVEQPCFCLMLGLLMSLIVCLVNGRAVLTTKKVAIGLFQLSL